MTSCSHSSSSSQRKASSRRSSPALLHLLLLLLLVLGAAMTSTVAAPICIRLHNVQDWDHAPTQLELIRLFKELDLPVTLGVVSNHTGASDPAFVTRLGELLNDPQHETEVALAGMNHETFQGMPLSQQESLLANGRQQLQSIFPTLCNVTTFSVPFNLFDQNTLQALQNTQYKTYSAGEGSQSQFADGSDLYSVPALAYTYDPDDNGTRISVSITYNQVKRQISSMGFSCILMTGKEHSIKNSHEPDDTHLDNTRSLLEQLKFEGHTFVPVGRMNEAVLNKPQTRIERCATPKPTSFRCGKECFNEWDCQSSGITQNNLFVSCVENRCTCKDGFSGSGQEGDACRCDTVDWIQPNLPECLDTETHRACTPAPTEAPAPAPGPSPSEEEEEEEEEEDEGGDKTPMKGCVKAPEYVAEEDDEIEASYPTSCASAEHGAVCELECPAGHRPSNEMVCHDGTWIPDMSLGDGVAPFCVNTSLSCADPPSNPKNGSYPDDDSCSDVPDKSECLLTCDEGFVPASESAVCQGDTWTNITCGLMTTDPNFDGESCAGDGTWPKTKVGQTVVAVCKNEPSVVVVRVCDLETGWQPPSSDCEPSILRSAGPDSSSSSSSDGPIPGLNDVEGWVIIGVCIAVGLLAIVSAVCCALSRSKK